MYVDNFSDLCETTPANGVHSLLSLNTLTLVIYACLQMNILTTLLALRLFF